jgi:hypothetical protein
MEDRQLTTGLVGRYQRYKWLFVTYTVSITQRGSRTPVFSVTTSQNPTGGDVWVDPDTRLSFDLRHKLVSGQTYTIKVSLLADIADDGKKPFQFRVSSKFVA